MYLPIISSETVKWSRPAGRIAPRAVPTKTQHTATRAIKAINHLNDPGFHDRIPQHPFGGSSENLPLEQWMKIIKTIQQKVDCQKKFLYMAINAKEKLECTKIIYLDMAPKLFRNYDNVCREKLIVFETKLHRSEYK